AFKSSLSGSGQLSLLVQPVLEYAKGSGELPQPGRDRRRIRRPGEAGGSRSLVHHGGDAAVCGPRDTALQPARDAWKRRKVDRVDPRNTALSRLAEVRGEIENSTFEIGAQKKCPVQPVFEYAKGSGELPQPGRDRR